MQPRGRRLLRRLFCLVLLLVLVVLGGTAWLYTSGRLAILAQGLIQDLSGQDITFTAVEFASWYTVAFIDVRVHQRLSNGRVEVFCPRLEADYGLRGLLHKRVTAIRLRRPVAEVHLRQTTTAAVQSSTAPRAPTMALLPSTRLSVEQGKLLVHWNGRRHAVQQLAVHLLQQDARTLHVEASGTLAGGTGTLRLRGHTPVDAPQPAGSWELTLQALPVRWLAQAVPSLVPPAWQLTHGALDTTARGVFHTPRHLSGTVTLAAAQLQAAVMGVRLHNGSFTATASIEANVGQRALDVRGNAEITIQTLRLERAPSATVFRIDTLRGRIPFHGNTTTVEFPDVRVYTRAWHWGTATTTPLLAPLAFHTTGTLDVQRQRLTLHQFEATLETLGTSTGSGTLDWPTRTIHDLRLQVIPTTAKALWHTLAAHLPTAYRAWEIDGQTRLDVRVPLLALRSLSTPQPLALTWHLQDVAFNGPNGNYAGEHVTGMLQATASLEAAAGRYTLQGTCAIQPFAILLGTLFPALEEQRVNTVVTFSATYQADTAHLRLYLAGQFGTLGTVMLHGRVLQSAGTPHYDLRGVLQHIDIGQLWQTFVTADTAIGPVALAETTVRGQLDAALQFHGTATALRLQGAVDVRDVHVHTPAVALEGAELQLPLRLHVPLAQTPPDTTLPAAAYGRLHFDRLRFPGFAIQPLTTRLALEEDTLVFPDILTLPLLDGQLRLEQLLARHLLRPSRHITLQAHVQHLNLQRLQRRATTLPLVGTIDGSFARIDIRGEQLDTDGVLMLRMAGGVVQLTDLRGDALFSSLPTLRCSLATREPLSLLRLTEIYPIGSIGGTLHFRVTDLTATAWEPATFRLTFHVQEKQGEKREITLRALNNLLFTTGSAKVELGQSYRLPYNHFGAEVTLRHDTLRLRGLYHDNAGREYFMVAPKLGGGVSIVNRVPQNGISFRDFLRRLKATVVDNPDVRVK